MKDPTSPRIDQNAHFKLFPIPSNDGSFPEELFILQPEFGVLSVCLLSYIIKYI